MKAPEVAAVIPAFNPGQLLVESVHSVLEQTLDSLELLVVDDGSDPDLFPRLPVDHRLRVIRQPNLGVSVARNRGVAASTAPLIAFLDADDRWAPTKLEKQVEALSRSSAAVLCHTGFTYVDREGTFVAPGWPGGASDYASLLEQNDIHLSSAVVRREAFQAAGGFDPLYSTLADWDLWLRLVQLGDFIRLPDTLADYRMSPHSEGQLSGDQLLAHREADSIISRHAMRARRTHNHTAHAATRAARRRSLALRSQQAADAFIDSLFSPGKVEWAKLSVACRISWRHTVPSLGRRMLARLKHAIARHVRM